MGAMKETGKETGVAVLGCGSWGGNHVRAWSQLGCLRMACDADPGRLRDLEAAYPGLETCQDVDAVLSRSDIAAVIVATPAPTHADLAARALQAGKDVLVEKPMALSVVEGRHLLELSRSLGRVLMVGHVLEYHPAVVKLRELVSEGALGRIQYVYSNRLNLGRIRVEESALWSFAPHDVAIILRLLGGMPDQVACHGGAYLNHGVSDVTLTDLRFPGNTGGHIFVSWLHPVKEQRFVVVGDRQMSVFDDTLPWSEKLTLYPHRVEWLEGQLPVVRRAEAVHMPLEEAEPLLEECQHFLRCVVTRQQPLTDGASGLDVLRVLDAAQRSLEDGGRPVQPDGLDGEPVPRGYYAHPTATVDPDAEVAAGTRIWHYSHVMDGATIGRDCILGQNVFVGKNVRVGDGVKVQNNVSVYEGVELEDHVFCGPSVVFTNVMTPRSEIERKDKFARTLVKRGATLGASCTVLCGVTIGRYAFAGAGSVITRDVPDHALVFGSPARVRGWMCRCGMKLSFTDGAATCTDCGDEYLGGDGETVAPVVAETVP